MRARAAMAAVAVLLWTAVAACAPRSTPGDADGAVELTIYAASSLEEALTEVERAYEATATGAILTVATDASSTLRAQIEQGAPADVFLAADQTNPSTLVKSGLADGQVVDFGLNRLAIIVPSDNPAGISSAADLARPGTRIVAAGSDVPITAYARQLVANLAALPGSPADFADAYEANVVTREANVKAVAAKIELGEGDAAIVYATDARAARNVTEIEIPAAANLSTTYAGVVIDGSLHPREAHEFLTWLAGPEGAAILARFGFVHAR